MPNKRIPFVDIYTTYGRPDRFDVAGRALRIRRWQLEEVGRSGRLSTVWHNLRRFAPREFEGHPVRVTAAGVSYPAITDSEGLFRITIQPERPVPAGFLDVEAAVLDLEGQPLDPPSHGAVQIISPESRLALVSDIDDTVLVSEVLERRKLLWNTFGRSVDAMRPVPGMAQAYHALVTQVPRPAVFYLSGSPIGLHRKLVAFLDRNGFPRGTMVLKNLGPRSLIPARWQTLPPFAWLDPADPLIDSFDYKATRIEALMSDLPDLMFVLVGDSGEKDPEVFRHVAQARPGRVAAIYIRNTTGALQTEERYRGQILFEDPRSIVDPRRALRAH